MPNKRKTPIEEVIHKHYCPSCKYKLVLVTKGRCPYYHGQITTKKRIVCRGFVRVFRKGQKLSRIKRVKVTEDWIQRKGLNKTIIQRLD